MVIVLNVNMTWSHPCSERSEQAVVIYYINMINYLYLHPCRFKMEQNILYTIMITMKHQTEYYLNNDVIMD